VAKFLEEMDVSSSLFIVLRIFVIDVQAIETIVLQEFDGGFDELPAECCGNYYGMERWRICPTTCLEFSINPLPQGYGNIGDLPIDRRSLRCRCCFFSR